MRSRNLRETFPGWREIVTVYITLTSLVFSAYMFMKLMTTDTSIDDLLWFGGSVVTSIVGVIFTLSVIYEWKARRMVE